MADELRNEQAQAYAAGQRSIEQERVQASIFAASMDRVAPQYGHAAREVGIKPEKAEGAGIFAKKGWKVIDRRSNDPLDIGGDIPEDDPSRRVAPRKTRGYVPRLYVFTEETWAFVMRLGGNIPRPERMSSFRDYSCDSLREQHMQACEFACRMRR